MLVPGPDVAIVAGAWDQPFSIPNYRVTGYRVPELVPISSWRSVGASGNGFLHEGFLDELIHAAGADPLKERIRLCWHEPSRKVLEAVGEMSNWGSDLGKDRGRGVAFTLSFGVPVAEVVEVTNRLRPHQDRPRLCRRRCRQGSGSRQSAQPDSGVVSSGARPRHECRADVRQRNGASRPTITPTRACGSTSRPRIEARVADQSEGGPRHRRALRAAGRAGLANAIFAATGQRIRELPLSKHVRFV